MIGFHGLFYMLIIPSSVKSNGNACLMHVSSQIIYGNRTSSESTEKWIINQRGQKITFEPFFVQKVCISFEIILLHRFSTFKWIAREWFELQRFAIYSSSLKSVCFVFKVCPCFYFFFLNWFSEVTNDFFFQLAHDEIINLSTETLNHAFARTMKTIQFAATQTNIRVVSEFPENDDRFFSILFFISSHCGQCTPILHIQNWYAAPDYRKGYTR